MPFMHKPLELTNPGVLSNSRVQHQFQNHHQSIGLDTFALTQAEALRPCSVNLSLEPKLPADQIWVSGAHCAKCNFHFASSTGTPQLCPCGSGGPFLPSIRRGPFEVDASSPTSQRSLPAACHVDPRLISPMRPSFCHHPQSHYPTMSRYSNQMDSESSLGVPSQKHIYSPIGNCNLKPDRLPARASTSSGITRTPLIPSSDSPLSFRSDTHHPPVIGRDEHDEDIEKNYPKFNSWARSYSNQTATHLHDRSSFMHSRGSGPLMKLSTLLIVLLAVLIIGFIVLSPLFHYLM